MGWSKGSKWWWLTKSQERNTAQGARDCRERSLPGPERSKYIGNFWFLLFLGSCLGGILFQEYCFGRENSPSSAANSVTPAKNSVSSLWNKNLTESGI